jgi:hypothetical protein
MSGICKRIMNLKKRNDCTEQAKRPTWPPAQPPAENGRGRPGASARRERHVINGHRASESHSGTLASGEQDDEEWRRQWVKLRHDEGDALGMVREAGAHRSGMALRRWWK